MFPKTALLLGFRDIENQKYYFLSLKGLTDLKAEMSQTGVFPSENGYYFFTEKSHIFSSSSVKLLILTL